MIELCSGIQAREPTRSIVVISVKHFQTELMVEISSKILVRAIGKVLLMKLARTPIKIHKVDENGLCL